MIIIISSSSSISIICIIIVIHVYIYIYIYTHIGVGASAHFYVCLMCYLSLAYVVFVDFLWLFIVLVNLFIICCKSISDLRNWSRNE